LKVILYPPPNYTLMLLGWFLDIYSYAKKRIILPELAISLFIILPSSSALTPQHLKNLNSE
ncbi:MAG: hypothetical protein WA461_03315, partial [Nitrososphaeraceae archaeon]